HLRERRTKADVEAPRAHADGERRQEVPGLVDQDQEREPEDGDEDAHAGASVRSTVSAMSRNEMRPARKAATATSFAALKAQGSVPPPTPASRASLSM